MAALHSLAVVSFVAAPVVAALQQVEALTEPCRGSHQALVQAVDIHLPVAKKFAEEVET